MTLETAGSSVSGGTPNVSAAVLWRTSEQAPSGVIIAPIAVVFMIYALWTFIVRAKRIARREPSTRYDDVFGPVALVVFFASPHGGYQPLGRERRLEPSRVRASDEILKTKTNHRRRSPLTSTTSSYRRISDRSRHLF